MIHNFQFFARKPSLTGCGQKTTYAPMEVWAFRTLGKSLS